MKHIVAVAVIGLHAVGLAYLTTFAPNPVPPWVPFVVLLATDAVLAGIVIEREARK